MNGARQIVSNNGQPHSRPSHHWGSIPQRTRVCIYFHLRGYTQCIPEFEKGNPLQNFIPRIGITLGDPAGIGTEIAVRTLEDNSIYQLCHPILFGSPDVVARELKQLGAKSTLKVVSPQDEVSGSATEVIVVETSGAEALVPYGQISEAGGEAAVKSIKAAVTAALAGEIDAITTAPLNKESMRNAGFHYDGHTELLAELTGCSSVSMLLIGNQLRVAHLTTHSALRTVSDKITEERLREVIRIAFEAMRNYGFASPRIAVAGINPHCGENGLFGDEEIKLMRPVIESIAATGIDVRGPISPDAVFIEAMADKHDIVVVAYHDQGHIPVKLIERDHAVNVSGGLPIIRTSVDHGTAFDIAGKGIADIVNMKAAITMAAKMAVGREAAGRAKSA
ncbi:MAG: 4-hydroxythreonine-4-phosphate dehydrogenase PdxA [Actinobacteria bacterium]|nr:4-hydroxythreonine-4-phosphate dehydrogenase PdxA [Actinomycetota bacterium]